MFAVDDLDETLARLERHGAQLVAEVVRAKSAETRRDRCERAPASEATYELVRKPSSRAFQGLPRPA
jgi:hypothetical protein